MRDARQRRDEGTGETMSYFDDREKARKAYTLDMLCDIYARHTDKLPDGKRLPLEAIAIMTAIARVLGKAGEFADYMRWYDSEGRNLPEPDETAVEELSPAFEKALARIRQMEREREKVAMN